MSPFESFPIFPQKENLEAKGESKTSRETTISRILENLEKDNIKGKVIEFPENKEFSKVIILEKETPEGKFVRLYRGVARVDESILKQVPYAMRSERIGGKPEILENLKPEVETLARNPTYENLMNYFNKVHNYLTPEELFRFEKDIKEIEEEILGGKSLREALVWQQIKHGGGWGESGITPYISASYDPYKAMEYARGGLIVIDVPLSEIEDFTKDSKECNIIGCLDKKYITAIVIREFHRTEEEHLKQELDRVLKEIQESVPVDLYKDEELKREREKKLKNEEELDRKQWEIDVEKVRQNRVRRLREMFPDVSIDLENIPEGMDIYTKAKRDIFDFYEGRLRALGRHIEDYSFTETEYYGTPKKFDRENITETMLVKLKALVEHLEKREKERQKEK
jgi:hypothetical protein